MKFILKYILYAGVYLLLKFLEWVATSCGFISWTNQDVKTSEKAKPRFKVEERRILWRHKANLAYPTSPWDFLSWPTRLTGESAILRDDVSLYCITESQAWFVQTASDVDVYSSDTDAFLYASQFKWARKIYVVSIDVLITLADSIGQPKLPVVIIWSHGRCGSTLLSQVFETVPDVVTLSEPDVLTNVLWLRWQNKITTERLQAIVPALMKILCRSLNNRPVSMFCIKTRSSCIAVADIIAERVPSIKHIYLYRDCATAVSSMERSFAQGLDVVKFWYKCFKSKTARNLVPRVTTNQLMAIFSVFDMTNERYKSVADPEFLASLTPLGLWTVNWAIPCADYLRLRQSGVNIRGVRYEDLIRSTEAIVKGLSQHTGISLDPDVVVKDVMPKDSQRGSTLSQDKINSYAKLIPDGKSKAEMQFIIARLGLPDVEHETMLEGTITVD